MAKAMVPSPPAFSTLPVSTSPPMRIIWPAAGGDLAMSLGLRKNTSSLSSARSTRNAARPSTARLAITR